MSKFAILTKIRPGPWSEDGEIMVNVDHVAAIEEENGCGGQHTRLTLVGGREVCVRGNHVKVRRALVRQAIRETDDGQSAFERVFGRDAMKGFFR